MVVFRNDAKVLGVQPMYGFISRTTVGDIRLQVGGAGFAGTLLLNGRWTAAMRHMCGFPAAQLLEAPG